MSSKVVFGTASSNVVLGTSPGSSTVAYASMDSLPPLASKTGAVYKAQSKPPLDPAENKGDSAQKFEEADSFSRKGKDAYNKKNYHSSYLNYLQAKGLYEQLPQDAASLKKLIQVNYDLAWAAREIRNDRREIARNIAPCAVLMLVAVGCFFVPYYVCKLKSSHWVDNEKFRSYIDNGVKILDDYIQAIHKDHKISMGTDKNTVQDVVRQDLGWAYSFKAKFYSIQEIIYGMDQDSDCCFEGTNGNHDASIYDTATALDNLKLAKEWDPSNQSYSVEYRRLANEMRRTNVDVTVHVS